MTTAELLAARSYAGKRMAIFGLGRSGLACALGLRAGGATVICGDDDPGMRSRARNAGLDVSNLHEADFSSFDFLVLSPGIPLTHPEPHEVAQKARNAGTAIIGDTEVFRHEIAGHGATVIAITGTNGKSTTTALIGHLLKTAGRDVHIGGNIGRPVFELPPPRQGRIYVLEVSSYQLALTPSLKPDIGVLLNLSPDHLDRHGDMQAYAAVKAGLFSNQQYGNTAVISCDDPYCETIARTVRLSGGPRVIPISVSQRLDDGISAADGFLSDQTQPATPKLPLDLTTMRALRGRHNWQNACAAYAVARSAGVSAPEIAGAMSSFGGLAHRLQRIAQRGRVIFVNDSKATNAQATRQALNTYRPIYWIAGGRTKAGGIASLADRLNTVAHAYLIGEAAEDFAATLKGRIPCTISRTLEKAVKSASRDASRDASPEPVVLLSPACASFDQFADFEARGAAFCAAVAGIDGVVPENPPDVGALAAVNLTRKAASC